MASILLMGTTPTTAQQLSMISILVEWHGFAIGWRGGQDITGREHQEVLRKTCWMNSWGRWRLLGFTVSEIITDKTRRWMQCTANIFQRAPSCTMQITVQRTCTRFAEDQTVQVYGNITHYISVRTEGCPPTPLKSVCCHRYFVQWLWL